MQVACFPPLSVSARKGTHAMKVSLTTFIDFTSANGHSKLTVIRRAKENMDRQYLPSQDYYSYLRDEVVDLLKRGRPKGELDQVFRLAPTARHDNYRDRVDGLKRWMGTKSFQWLDPIYGVWSESGLDVRVNPELHVLINGTPHVVKLYWKSDPLSKRRADPTLHLLDKVCASGASATPAILDVQNSKLFVKTVVKPKMDLYLRTEAQAFMTLWDSL